jgi:hypothetical protein
MTTLLVIAWFLLGFGLNLLLCWEVYRKVTIRDFLTSFFTGLVGPCMIVIYLIFSPKNWLDHKIF